MDPSALIFIALAAAWAIYLIPKALEHHEESVRTRTVERFSATMRVLARREPVSRRRARLVRPRPARAASSDPTDRSSGSQDAGDGSLDARRERVRRAAAARAARRRLRVVSVILFAIAVVVALAALHVVGWRWPLLPVAVLVVWLVACRVMVKSERRSAGRVRRARPAPAPAAASAASVATDETGPIPVVPGDAAAPLDPATDPATTDPKSWDPVPVTLPTYVSKPVAPRSVQTIDLDSTGVWSSGRSESDSDLVREADARKAETRDETARSQRRRA